MKRFRSGKFRSFASIASFLGVFSISLTPPLVATPNSRNSPAGGTLPSGFTEVGGVVADLVGANDNRVTSQLPASSLFSGFFDGGSPTTFQGNPGTIGIQTGFTQAIIDSLGGGLKSIGVRVTLEDGDTGPGDFDEDSNFLLINGVNSGNFSDVVTEETSSDGTILISTNSAGGFRDDTLDTGWFLISNASTLGSIFSALAVTGQLVFQLNDTDDPFDNRFDFTAGVDGGLIDSGMGPSGTVPTAAPGRRTTREPQPIFVTNLSAILSVLESGLPMAMSQREIAIGAGRSIYRDVNGRLFRARATAGDLTVVASAEPYLNSSGDTGISGETETSAKESFFDKQPAYFPEEDDSPFSFFVGTDYSRLDYDAQGIVPGIVNDTWTGHLGFEVPLLPNLTFGLGTIYLDAENDVGSIGNVDVEGWSIAPYLTYVRNSFWADALYGYSWLEHDIYRRSSFGPSARADTDSGIHRFEFNTGYNIKAGRGIVTGPVGAFEFMGGNIDGYTERGGGATAVRTPEQDYESYITRLGWQASAHVRTGFGKIIPQIRAHWDHEYGNDPELVSASLVTSPFSVVTGSSSRSVGGFSVGRNTEPPQRDYLNLGAGVLFQFGDDRDGWKIILDYEGHLLRDDHTAHFGSARVVIPF
ncbi:MAG: autotransporter outer membrane beta-barrel domain-containing protein [Verrucomicrobiota bacterium]